MAMAPTTAPTMMMPPTTPATIHAAELPVAIEGASSPCRSSGTVFRALSLGTMTGIVTREMGLIGIQGGAPTAKGRCIPVEGPRPPRQPWWGMSGVILQPCRTHRQLARDAGEVSTERIPPSFYNWRGRVRNCTTPALTPCSQPCQPTTCDGLAQRVDWGSPPPKLGLFSGAR